MLRMLQDENPAAGELEHVFGQRKKKTAATFDVVGVLRELLQLVRSPST